MTIRTRRTIGLALLSALIASFSVTAPAAAVATSTSKTAPHSYTPQPRAASRVVAPTAIDPTQRLVPQFGVATSPNAKLSSAAPTRGRSPAAAATLATPTAAVCS